MSMKHLCNSLDIVSGAPKNGRLTATGIFRDEMYFLPAFLDHYRRLGVAQFLIIDDGSSDGSVDFLARQADCVVLRSPYAYGQKVNVDINGKASCIRAGIPLKSAAARRFLAGEWALNLDADEFLLLPPGVTSLPQLIGLAETLGARAVTASLVDFYPATLAGLEPLAARPERFEDLQTLAPYFDAIPVIAQESDGAVRKLNGGPSLRLFRDLGIREAPKFMSKWPLALTQHFRFAVPNKAPVVKTPLIRWDDGVQLHGSHVASVRADARLLIAAAHFKFNPDFYRRIQMATTLRSYASNSARYDHYVEMVARMRRSGRGFLGPDSRIFQSVDDLVAAGLMRVLA